MNRILLRLVVALMMPVLASGCATAPGVADAADVREALHVLEENPWSGIHFYTSTEDLAVALRNVQRIGIDGITDEVAPLLLEFTEMHTLSIGSSEVDLRPGYAKFNFRDSGIVELARHQSLRYLAISYARITDSGLLALGRLQSLRRLALFYCPLITRTAVDEFRRARPDVHVEFIEPPQPPPDDDSSPDQG